MKATIGVYDSHLDAIEAVKELKDAGYPVKHLSIIGLANTEHVDEDMHVIEVSPVKLRGIETGTALGVILGVLTGVGVLAIPGLGFLLGAGAVAGAIAGFDIGLIGGGIATVLINLGMHEDVAKKYQRDLEEGKYLVVAQGSDAEIKNAKDILAEHGTHTALQMH